MYAAPATLKSSSSLLHTSFFTLIDSIRWNNMNNLPLKSGHALEAPLAPITASRRCRIDTDKVIERPYLPRASVAPSAEHPDGSVGHAEKFSNYVSTSPITPPSLDDVWPRSLSYSNIVCTGTGTATASSGRSTPGGDSAISDSTFYSVFWP